MTLDEALVIVAQSHPRYRLLCSEDNPNVEQRDAYRKLVMEKALAPIEPKETPEARPTVRRTLNDLAKVRLCPSRLQRTDCGCGGLATCTLGKGKDGLVNQLECLACVRGEDQDGQ